MHSLEGVREMSKKDDAEKFRADLMEAVSGISKKVDEMFGALSETKPKPKPKKDDGKDDDDDDDDVTDDGFGFTLLG